jgi:energy-coupling factor transport system ATP-binding protein
MVGMEAYRYHAPHLLSGGQQQKVVIAGILAMECEILVLDEPTSMLDLRDREEILDLFKKIQQQGSQTLLHITHSFEEALSAQDLIYLDHGQIVYYGPPEEFMAGNYLPEIFRAQLPPIFQLIQGLRDRGHSIPPGTRTFEELKETLLKMRSEKNQP